PSPRQSSLLNHSGHFRAYRLLAERPNYGDTRRPLCEMSPLPFSTPRDEAALPPVKFEKIFPYPDATDLPPCDPPGATSRNIPPLRPRRPLQRQPRQSTTSNAPGRHRQTAPGIPPSEPDS